MLTHWEIATTRRCSPQTPRAQLQLKNQQEMKGSLVKKINNTVKWSALALLTVLLSCGLMAASTTVRIDASKGGAHTVEVLNSEAYNVYVGPQVSDPAIEFGGLIDLLGVDNLYYVYPNIPNQGWRFTDPKAPTLVRDVRVHVI